MQSAALRYHGVVVMSRVRAGALYAKVRTSSAAQRVRKKKGRTPWCHLQAQRYATRTTRAYDIPFARLYSSAEALRDALRAARVTREMRKVRRQVRVEPDS